MTKKLSLPSTSPMMQPSFLFGTATSSFQIEGDAEGRLECMWDGCCRQAGAIAEKSDGLRACEYVERWEEDVNLIHSLGVDAYRLSISWPRVMHANGEINEQGLAFYKQLIDKLNSLNIKAFVTLYHWDLPQYLEQRGGWLNRQTAYEFENYVDKISAALGERVYSYATFNEPFCSAYLGYEIGVHAPGKTGREHGRTAAHHILLAHGLGMKMLKKNVPNAQNGIVLNFTPCYSASDSPADIAATKKADQYINQWYMQPVMEGCYPDVIHELAEKDKPPIQDGDMETICQPLDFLGINFYTRLHYSAPRNHDELYFEHPHYEPKTDIGWEIHPPALTHLLTSLHQRYALPPVYITENGAAMADEVVDGRVEDNDRIEYYQNHLLAVEKAMDEGVKVSGYFAWSLMDNFEWAEGYEKRFGIVYVDFDTQSRILKDSAKAFKALLAQRT
mgnify:FL=1